MTLKGIFSAEIHASFKLHFSGKIHLKKKKKESLSNSVIYRILNVSAVAHLFL